MRPYYEHAGITIYHEDWREAVGSLSFDVVITDPPYGKGLDYGNGVADSRAAFVANCEDMLALGKPLAFSCPQTRMFDVPKPQWVGVWHKPMSFGFWTTPFYPHWEPIMFYGLPMKLGHHDVWTYGPEKPNGHPCPKPLPLMKDLVLAMPHGVVLDPFAGSGTTLRAAKDLGRRAIGIEIEERYCEIAAKRLAQEVMPL